MTVLSRKTVRSQIIQDLKSVVEPTATVLYGAPREPVTGSIVYGGEIQGTDFEVANMRASNFKYNDTFILEIIAQTFDDGESGFETVDETLETLLNLIVTYMSETKTLSGVEELINITISSIDGPSHFWTEAGVGSVAIVNLLFKSRI